MTPFSNLFLLAAIEELPTFLLALGSMFSVFRTDLGFGLSFFLLRICYHLYLFTLGMKIGIETPVIGVFVLTLTMHLNWFYAWVSKYGVAKKKKDVDVKKTK